MKAKELYERGCTEYLRLFCEKHDFDFGIAKHSWVGGKIGDVAMCGDYFVSMNVIMTNIDENAPEDEFFKYNEYCLNASEFNITIPNFHSWIKGCPRTSEDSFERLRNIKKSLEDAVEEENKNILGQESG